MFSKTTTSLLRSVPTHRIAAVGGRFSAVAVRSVHLNAQSQQEHHRSSPRSQAKFQVGAVLAGAAALYWYNSSSGKASAEEKKAPNTAAGADLSKVQPTVVSQGKANAAYIWIHLAPGADVKKVAAVVASLDKIVDKIVPPADRDEDEELLVGVGFGPELVKKLNLKAPHDFSYVTRTHEVGSMPATGGDIFVHAKSNVKSNVFDFAMQLQAALPAGSVAKWEDRYGWVFRNGRDLSGFIDGTMNPAAEDDRVDAAVIPETGGSYVITQRWIHDLKMPQVTPVKQQEEFVGRTKDNSVQLDPLPKNSHVARMLGTDASGKKINIVRQSMPYGTTGGDSGLFFIAYAKDPANFNYMLDRMTGKSSDGLHDNVMRFTKCVSGNYWFVPSVPELKRLAQ